MKRDTIFLIYAIIYFGAMAALCSAGIYAGINNEFFRHLCVLFYFSPALMWYDHQKRSSNGRFFVVLFLFFFVGQHVAGEVIGKPPFNGAEKPAAIQVAPTTKSLIDGIILGLSYAVATSIGLSFTSNGQGENRK